MSDNLKVNALTKILRFKEQHNKLVDKVEDVESDIADLPTEQDVKNLIQANKDILSQLVYESVGGYTKITFPKNVLPIHIYLDETEYYFDYVNEFVLDDTGALVSNSSVSVENDIVQMSLQGIFGEICNLSYILFNETEDMLNTYYLFNPRGGGTKLYKHDILMSAINITINFSIINFSASQILLSDFENGIRVGIDCLVISLELNRSACLFLPADLIYDDNEDSLVDSNGVIDCQFDSTPTIIDDVTEL